MRVEISNNQTFKKLFNSATLCCIPLVSCVHQVADVWQKYTENDSDKEGVDSGKASKNDRHFVVDHGEGPEVLAALFDSHVRNKVVDRPHAVRGVEKDFDEL